MDEKIQFALKQAILQSLPTLQSLLGYYSEQSQVWTKQDEGWRSEYQYQLKPDLFRVFIAAENQLNENGARFTKLFFDNHPEYEGMVCFGGFGGRNFSDRVSIFKAVINRLWVRYETFNCNDAAVNEIVEEVTQFIKQPMIRYHFQAQLLNFTMIESTISFPENLTIRKLNEQEMSSFLNDPINPSSFFDIHEFIIEGEDEFPKIFGYPDNIAHPTEKVRSLLDRAILCLRTFKQGPIGYNSVKCKPLNFCPFGLGTHGKTDVYIPFGRYDLLSDEIVLLDEYAKLIFPVSEASMEMALSRLADAEIRTKPQDKIVDAVIGMEVLLLAALGKDDRKGELSFRFSLNYSMLFPSVERPSAFKLAKDLYNIRSTIAHGSSIDEMVKIDGNKIALSDAANKATEVLRIIISHFLPEQGAPYKNNEFWKNKYFGLTNSD
jgi:Apea-like HEPN